LHVQIERLGVPAVVLVTPHRHADERGFLSVTWNRAQFAAAAGDVEFVQDTHSLSSRRGTVRGLHCQVAPHPQGKLVRVARGAIWDVAVDIRHGSPSFGRYVAAELSAANWRQLWIPVGFLHGFCTLADDTEVIYKVSGDYDPNAERGVLWCDPALAIPWPVDSDEAVLSARDRALPPLSAATHWFPA
jgi:dTDP-4-dehydrorhamnose 3,5-epimerase